MPEELQKEEFAEFLAGRLLKKAGGEFAEDEDQASQTGGVASPEKPVTDEPVGTLATHSEVLPRRLESEGQTDGDFLKVDKSLASIGYFSPSSRRLKTQLRKTIEFPSRNENGKKIEKGFIEILANEKYGLPNTADQDKFFALQHIITNILKRDGKVTNPIRFTSAEILRLLGKETDSGKNYYEINQWLGCMKGTTIETEGVVYNAKHGVLITDRLNVFDRTLSAGALLPDGKIADAHYVWLADWQLDNINAKFLLPIDLFAYRDLRNHIAKALVPHLQVWLYASQRAGRYEKKYDELCVLLGLKVHRSKSRIMHQLGPSLDELVRADYLRMWQLGETSDGSQRKLILFHGAKFFRDQKHRLREKMQSEEWVVIAESTPAVPSLPEPDWIESSDAVLPAKRGRGRRLPGTVESALAVKTESINAAAEIKEPEHQNLEVLEVETSETPEAKLMDELSARGLMPSSALKLLRAMPVERLEKVFDYIDYWDETKKTKDVGEGFLYNLIKDGQPLPANFETRRQHKERQAAEQRKRQLARLDQEIKTSYSDHCSRMVDRFIAEEVPPEELERRIADRKRELIEQGGFWDGPNREEITTKMALREVRAELSSGVKVSYEDFYRRQLPAVLAKLELDPVELGLKDVLST